MVNIFNFEKSLKLSWIKQMAKQDKTDWYKLLQISIKNPKNIFFLVVSFVPPLFKILTLFGKLYFNTGNYTVTPKEPPGTKTCY